MSEHVPTVAMINSDGKTAPPRPDPEGLRTVLVDLRLRVMARSPYDRLLTDLITVDAAEAALASGADVLLIDTFADYGLDAVRSISPVPVVGAGEATLRSLAVDGRRVSIVTVWPESTRFHFEERLAHCEGGDRVAGLHFFSSESELALLGTEHGVKERMRRGEGDLVDALADACRAAVAADGSDGVLLGCTCMTPVADTLRERTGMHVVDPSVVGLQTAWEVAATARRGPLPPAAERAGEVVRVMDAWVAAGGPTAPPGADCEICAWTPPSTV